MKSVVMARGSRARRRNATSIVAGLMAALAIASNVAAGGPAWTSPVSVRTDPDVELQDADFTGQDVAVAWQEPGASGPSVRIRRSGNSGASFGANSVFQESRQAAVDFCRSPEELNAVYARRIAPGNWLIEHVQDSGAGDLALSQFVSPGSGVQRFPDIACAGEHVFVSWFQKEGSGDRLWLAHKRRPAAVDGFTPFTRMDLGFDSETFFGSSLAVAGTPDAAYVVFSRSDGDLRFKRWTIGPGPGFALTPHATVVIGNGKPDNSASEAVIAARGSKVAVAWFRCGGVMARVSNDWGATWGPVHEVIDHQACFGDFGASQRSIAINSGGEIAISYLAFGIPDASFVGLIRTGNDFANFADDTIRQNGDDEHLVGYVTVNGVTKLAAAFDRGDRIRFRRQV